VKKFLSDFLIAVFFMLIVCFAAHHTGIPVIDTLPDKRPFQQSTK
jgi:hypothetical protein